MHAPTINQLFFNVNYKSVPFLDHLELISLLWYNLFQSVEGRKNAYHAIVHAQPPYLDNIYIETQASANELWIL